MRVKEDKKRAFVEAMRAVIVPQEPTRSEWIAMYCYHNQYPGVPLKVVWEMKDVLND